MGNIKHKSKKKTEIEETKYDLTYIDELYTLENELPGLLTYEHKKDLNEFEKKFKPSLQWLSEGRRELIHHISIMKLQSRREMQEVKYLFETGNPQQILTLVENEINWLENPKKQPRGFPWFVSRERIDEILTRPRYDSDPIGKGGYLALFIKDRRKDVIKWWNDLLIMSEIFTDDSFKNQLEELQIKTEQLINRIKFLFPSSQPWKSIEKIDEKTFNTVRDYLYNSLLQFIKESYPNLTIKTGKANGVLYYKLNPSEREFEEMIEAFLQQNAFTSQGLKKLLKKWRAGSAANLNSNTVTIRKIVDCLIQSKYGISERTKTRKSKRKNLTTQN